MLGNQNNNIDFNNAISDNPAEIVEIAGVDISVMPNDEHEGDAENKSENDPNEINIVKPTEAEAPITINIDKVGKNTRSGRRNPRSGQSKGQKTRSGSVTSNQKCVNTTTGRRC